MNANNTLPRAWWEKRHGNESIEMINESTVEWKVAGLYVYAAVIMARIPAINMKGAQTLIGVNDRNCWSARILHIISDVLLSPDIPVHVSSGLCYTFLCAPEWQSCIWPSLRAAGTAGTHTRCILFFISYSFLSRVKQRQHSAGRFRSSFLYREGQHLITAWNHLEFCGK